MEPRNPATEAAEWLATLTDPSCTDEERQRFVEWLKRSNLHVDEFLRISSLARRLTRSKIWPQHQIEELIAQATAPEDNTIAHLPTSARRPNSADDQSTQRVSEWRTRAIDEPASGISERAHASSRQATALVENERSQRAPAPSQRMREAVATIANKTPALRTQRLRGHTAPADRQWRTSSDMRTQRFRWAMAIGLAGLVAAIALAFARFDPFAWRSDTYTTAIGELRSITLEDGSVVDLNTSSTLRTHFTAKQRTVELLRGEAVFKVAKNPQRPFLVATGSTEIVAVGTQFNVYARDARTVVTVLEGRVRVTDKAPSNRTSATTAVVNQPLELSPGEQAVIAPHRPIARVKLADATPVTSWTERRLIFEDTPLSAAADEFARYNTRMIRIEDPKLRDLRVTGVFDATDPASLVQFVEAYGNVSVSTREDGWMLSPLR
jgi:transmembrane sensor